MTRTKSTRKSKQSRPRRAARGSGSRGTGAIYFASPAEFRAWLAAHHASRDALLVGFHTRASGKPSLTWVESVEEALCFGWIDGKRQNVDPTRYTIRFTPRRSNANWSAINIRKAKQLIDAGRMEPAGVRAYEARSEERSRVYAHERELAATLSPAHEQRFRANQAAWTFFSAQPPYYRRATYHWVISAKRAETRESRLATLIADSAAGRWIRGMQRPGQRGK